MLNKVFLIFIFVFYIIILALFSREGFPKAESYLFSFPFLSEKPLTEDGFYSLTVGWNIGTGKGITYKLSEPTSGFQPLFVIIISPIAWLINAVGGSKSDFLRAVIIFSGVLMVVFLRIIQTLTNLISQETDKNIVQTFIILLVLFNYKLFLNFFNGLETGLYLTLICVSVIYSVNIVTQKKPLFHYAIFGMILGLTSLARIDFLLPAMLALFTFLFLKIITLKQFSLVTVTLTVLIMPWFIYVYNISGSFFPSSVLVQSCFQISVELSDRIDKFFFALLNPFIPFLYTGLTNTLIFYVPSLVILFLIIKQFTKNIRVIFNIENLNILFIWGISFFILIFIYFVFASVPYFFLRYFSPMFIISIPLLGIILASYFDRKGLIFFKLFVLIVFILFSANNILNLFFEKGHTTLAARSSVLNNDFFKDKRIGLFQSGIAGFYFDNIVNLDGKVSHAALKYSKQNKLEKYIDSIGINVMFEWKEAFGALNENYLESNWKLLDKVFDDGKSVMYIRKHNME